MGSSFYIEEVWRLWHMLGIPGTDGEQAGGLLS